ncbi:MAG: hypothetical protein ACK4MX_10600 [Thermaurantiacus sp.]
MPLFRVTIPVIAALVAAAPASAQSVQPFVDCSAKVDDADRLACYDAAAAALSADARRIAAQREQERKVAAEARAIAEAKAAADAAAAAEQAQADRFGSEGLRIGRGGDERVDRLTATIGELLTDRGGRAVMVLDNGQMWRQTEGLSLPPVRANEAVEIRRGAMGSYRATLTRIGRSFSVVRMR